MPMRVLIVDGDKEFVHLLKLFISKYEELKVIGEAYTGASALEILKNEFVDILLLELALPHIDGLELLKTIKELDCIKPEVFILSAVSNNAIIRDALRLGAAAYYVKPFDLDSTFGHILYYMKLRFAKR
ncbi:MAG: Stage 0 sporulation protein A [Firmicutes bacterium ADurb.Bin356]|nr:MAG: Stage 0 sporulation protein A [Firmicutes bacterium ADurb.Bin356]